MGCYLELFIASWLKITSEIKVFLNEVYSVLNKTEVKPNKINQSAEKLRGFFFFFNGDMEQTVHAN